MPKQSGFGRKRTWIAWSLCSSQRRRLIQPTLRRASIVRAGVGRRQRCLRRLRAGVPQPAVAAVVAGRRRTAAVVPGGRRRGTCNRGRARSCASRRNDSGGAGRRSGVRRRIGRYVLVRLVRHELFVARCARPRWNILGHAAGPGRPSVRHDSGERRARRSPEAARQSAIVSINKRLVVPAVKSNPRCPRRQRRTCAAARRS